MERARTDRNLETKTILEDGKVVEITPTDSILKGRSTLRLSKSLELNQSQTNSALGTFKVFDSQEFKQKPASSSKNVSEEVAEPTQTGPNKKQGRPRKEAKNERKTEASNLNNKFKQAANSLERESEPPISITKRSPKININITKGDPTNHANHDPKWIGNHDREKSSQT